MENIVGLFFDSQCMFVEHCNKKQQHQCIICCMHCRSLLSENSGQVSLRDSNTELCKLNSNSNFKTKVRKFKLSKSLRDNK